jgi:hypothetical protein
LDLHREEHADACDVPRDEQEARVRQRDDETPELRDRRLGA